MSEKSNKSIGEIIRENAVVLALSIGGMIISLIITWQSFSLRLTQVEAQVSQNTATITSVQNSESDIKVQLSQIQTDIQWIKAKLSNK